MTWGTSLGSIDVIVVRACLSLLSCMDVAGVGMTAGPQGRKQAYVDRTSWTVGSSLSAKVGVSGGVGMFPLPDPDPAVPLPFMLLPLVVASCSGGVWGSNGINFIMGLPRLLFLASSVSLTGARMGEPCGGESSGLGAIELLGVMGEGVRSGAAAGRMGHSPIGTLLSSFLAGARRGGGLR